MNARTVYNRAVAVRDRFMKLVAGDYQSLDEAKSASLCWRMSPKTWRLLSSELKFLSVDAVNVSDQQLLRIQVRLDLGPHPGDLILQLAIEDRQTGGLG